MCNAACIAWGQKSLCREEVAGKDVLEVGSYNINGSLRPIVAALDPASYLGVDLRPGPEVDVQCPAENLLERFGPERFDIVISTNTLEHIRHWQQAIDNIKQVCKEEGLILFSVPCEFAYHTYPRDYWRFQPEDLRSIFADCEILSLEKDPGKSSCVYIKLRKPPGFKSKNLDGYALYSIVTGKRATAFRPSDYFSIFFLRNLLRLGLIKMLTSLQQRTAPIKKEFQTHLRMPIRRFFRVE